MICLSSKVINILLVLNLKVCCISNDWMHKHVSTISHFISLIVIGRYNACDVNSALGDGNHVDDDDSEIHPELASLAGNDDNNSLSNFQ